MELIKLCVEALYSFTGQNRNHQLDLTDSEKRHAQLAVRGFSLIPLALANSVNRNKPLSYTKYEQISYSLQENLWGFRTMERCIEFLRQSTKIYPRTGEMRFRFLSVKQREIFTIFHTERRTFGRRLHKNIPAGLWSNFQYPQVEDYKRL